jgi:uncharacterized membrane protein YcaP (DUF421 family)
MITELTEVLNHWLGLGIDAKELTFFQVSFRGVIVFVSALVMLRLADKRFLAKLSAFDAILGFILASMLARAVNGSASFFPTLGGAFVIVGLHRLLGRLAFASESFGKLVKGESEVLVRKGKPISGAMKANKISRTDLLEEIRLNGGVTELESVETATIERNGEISVITEKECS